MVAGCGRRTDPSVVHAHVTGHLRDASPGDRRGAVVAKGWVYVLTNQSMPGLVKIGRTAGTPAARARELSRSTGVPTPFEVAYAFECGDAISAEKAAHDILVRHRVSGRREFFAVKPEVAAQAIGTVTGRGAIGRAIRLLAWILWVPIVVLTFAIWIGTPPEQLPITACVLLVGIWLVPRLLFGTKKTRRRRR